MEKSQKKFGVAKVFQYKNDIVFINEKSVVLDGWGFDAPLDSWVGGKAILRIALSNTN